MIRPWGAGRSACALGCGPRSAPGEPQKHESTSHPAITGCHASIGKLGKPAMTCAYALTRDSPALTPRENRDHESAAASRRPPGSALALAFAQGADERRDHLVQVADHGV